MNWTHLSNHDLKYFENLLFDISFRNNFISRAPLGYVLVFMMYGGLHDDSLSNYKSDVVVL